MLVQAGMIAVYARLPWENIWHNCQTSQCCTIGSTSAPRSQKIDSLHGACGCALAVLAGNAPSGFNGEVKACPAQEAGWC